jgi:hypothetical protein
LYRTPNIGLVRMIQSIRLRWVGHEARKEVDMSTLKILTVTSMGKSPVGIPRRRWEDNIRIDLKEIIA